MSLRKSILTWMGGCLTLLCITGSALAQSGTVTGDVRQADSGMPIEGAQVRLDGTGFAGLTLANGRYLLVNVPAGTYTIVTEMIGHTADRQSITVTAGQTTTVNVMLSAQAIAMQEIVVTGTVGATQKIKLPFSVEQLGSRNLPVSSVNAATSIQGKIAGAQVVSGSGRPGSAPSILLRGATSLDAGGRSQEPLYIVDGVILGSSMADIDGLDIENIEIVKGAAAASLYGSRAANGVVQITTKRGRTVATDQIQYTVRSEYGRTGLPREVSVPMSHFYKMENGKLVDKNGDPCDYFETCSGPQLAGQRAAPGQAANVWNTYMSEEWPGKTYNQVDEFFQSGRFMQNYISASGRTGATNFHIAFTNLDESGVMPGVEGFKRNNFRVNLDQAVMENLTVSASSFISRSSAGQLSETGGSLFGLRRMPPGVNLKGCQDDPSKDCMHDPQKLRLQPDPGNSESPNPLYELLIRDWKDKRNRYLGSANLRYTPLEWLGLDGNISYDRLDFGQSDMRPKGYRTIGASANREGSLYLYDEVNESLNASITASMSFDLGGDIRNRTQFRYLYERGDENWNWASGNTFAVGEVPTLGNISKSSLSAASEITRTVADGYFAITGFDIKDRYFIDALLRNDGSSLFGADQRRHWYHRLAVGWRMTEEPWFNISFLDEFKPRFSYGTAGSRPRFNAQYESYNVSGGAVSPVRLGNKDLKPEFSKEIETGIDALMFNGQMGLTLTYAQTTTEDQILRQPLSAYMGFADQWKNAGTLQSKTWEASLDARLLQTDNLTWSARVNFDRTRSMITELNIPAYAYGVGGQGMEAVFWARKGEQVGTFYGTKVATGCGDLPAGVDCGAFTTNQDGLLVYVGPGGKLSDQKWGTNSEGAGIFLNGNPVQWGTPIKGECTDVDGTRTNFCAVGKTQPDYTVGLSSTLAWKGLTLYGLADATQGFNVFNQPMLWAIFKRWGADIVDQRFVPEDDRKPIGYYEALYGTSGLNPNSYFVEDGSYIKLRELSLRYRLDSQQLGWVPGLSAFDGISLSLTGRNLVTWSGYRGYDPEVGRDGGDTGSAALARVEGYQYPNFRTWTFGIELNF